MLKQQIALAFADVEKILGRDLSLISSLTQEDPLVALEELCTVVNEEPVAFSEGLLVRIRSLAEHFESERCIRCLDGVRPDDASRPWMSRGHEDAPAIR